MLLRQMSSMKEGGSTGAAKIMFNIISESCQNMYSALFFGDFIEWDRLVSLYINAWMHFFCTIRSLGIIT